MEAKEILAQVKQFFTDLMAPPPAPAAAAGDAPPSPAATEYELKIGGKVTIDKLESGGIVLIDGNPAVAGDLELADGTIVTVGDNGVITAVVPGAGGEDMATKFAAFETSTNEKFTNYETKFAAQELQLSEMKVSLAKATKVIGKLLELSELIVDQPAGKPDPAAAAFKDELKHTPSLFN